MVIVVLKTNALQTAELLNVLPDQDISMVNTLIKKLILAWDPDFTKLTPEERKKVEEADAEFKKGEYISEEDFWK